jgi:hypothetical protein
MGTQSVKGPCDKKVYTARSVLRSSTSDAVLKTCQCGKTAATIALTKHSYRF